MSEKSDNYFNLLNPDDLYCRIEFYRADLLSISMYEVMEKPLLYLYFYTPTYIQLPREWKGASFRLGNLEEHITLWASIWAGSMTQEEFLKYSHLYIAEVDTDLQSPKTVQIVASKAGIDKAKSVTQNE